MCVCVGGISVQVRTVRREGGHERGEEGREGGHEREGEGEGEEEGRYQ